MTEIDPQAVGVAIGAVILVIASAIKGAKEFFKSDGKPPADRAPSQHETRAEIKSLRDELGMVSRLIADALHRIERNNGTLSEEHRELRRLLGEIEGELRKIRGDE
ncbi:hypothetical protein ACMA5I_06595 [Paracoccaceae bacterium GXU_MW_L88]